MDQVPLTPPSPLEGEREFLLRVMVAVPSVRSISRRKELYFISNDFVAKSAHPADMKPHRYIRNSAFVARPSWSFSCSAWLFCLLVLLALGNANAQNKVLSLDGTGGYVELPPNIFNDLEEATIEAWVRWDDFSGAPQRVFNYGDARRDFTIGSTDSRPTLWFVVGDAQQQLHEIAVPNLLRTQQWCHVAAVSGKSGMKLYLNGALAGTNAYTGSFAGLNNG